MGHTDTCGTWGGAARAALGGAEHTVKTACITQLQCIVREDREARVAEAQTRAPLVPHDHSAADHDMRQTNGHGHVLDMARVVVRLCIMLYHMHSPCRYGSHVLHST